MLVDLSQLSPSPARRWMSRVTVDTCDELAAVAQPACCTTWASWAMACWIWVVAGGRILPLPIS